MGFVPATFHSKCGFIIIMLSHAKTSAYYLLGQTGFHIHKAAVAAVKKLAAAAGAAAA